MINKEEILFYSYIQPLRVVFDIGCRTDVDYIKLSTGITFHMFEPNPVFFKKLARSAKEANRGRKNIIHLNPYGLSNKTGEFCYYIDSQSFIPRSTYFSSNLDEKRNCFLKSFQEYLKDNLITTIDFLKIDIEGGEPDIISDEKNSEFLKGNVNYVQFEYASTWLDRGDGSDLETVFSVYKDNFDFYFLRNENHPIAPYCPTLLSKIVDLDSIKIIDSYVKSNYGFEIIMANKEKI